MSFQVPVYLTHPQVPAWNFSTKQLEKLQNAFPELSFHLCPNSREFYIRLAEADGVIGWFFKEEWLAQAPKLKWISTPAAGKDWMKVPESAPVQIFHGSFHGPMIAESVIGAMFYFLKAFPLSLAFQKEKKWARVKISQQLASLYQAQVTILGFGNIGQIIAQRLKVFDCRIVGVKRKSIPAPVYFSASDSVVTSDKLEEVLKSTDHLVFALPGGDETQEIFTNTHFDLLPEHCLIYNIGRGNVYCEADLVSVLTQEKIAGAYLDVFETEPLPETSELWSLPNVLIQPHLSAASPHYLDLFAEELIARKKELMASLD